MDLQSAKDWLYGTSMLTSKLDLRSAGGDLAPVRESGKKPIQEGAKTEDKPYMKINLEPISR